MKKWVLQFTTSSPTPLPQTYFQEISLEGRKKDMGIGALVYPLGSTHWGWRANRCHSWCCGIQNGLWDYAHPQVAILFTGPIDVLIPALPSHDGPHVRGDFSHCGRQLIDAAIIVVLPSFNPPHLLPHGRHLQSRHCNVVSHHIKAWFLLGELSIHVYRVLIGSFLPCAATGLSTLTTTTSSFATHSFPGQVLGYYLFNIIIIVILHFRASTPSPCYVCQCVHKLNLSSMLDTPVSNGCGNGKLSPLFCKKKNGGVIQEIVWLSWNVTTSTFIDPGCGG